MQDVAFMKLDNAYTKRNSAYTKFTHLHKPTRKSRKLAGRIKNLSLNEKL